MTLRATLTKLLCPHCGENLYRLDKDNLICACGKTVPSAKIEPAQVSQKQNKSGGKKKDSPNLLQEVWGLVVETAAKELKKELRRL